MKILMTAALALTLATPALAQRTKKPGADLEESAGKKAKDVVRPDLGVDALQAADDDATEKLIADKEKKLSEVRQRQIKQMRSILKKNPLYKKKADLLFRIAEKEWDEAKYRYFLVRKQYEKQFEAFLNGTLKKKPADPVPDYGLALTEYKKLLKEFPNYRRIDEVMFYLGRGLSVAGKKKEGASYMLRLTKDFPKSKYVTQAYLAVAEYYFDNDLLFAAKTNYLKVLENEKSSQYPYALYKLGYVQYNLREYEDSIRSFQRVVEMSTGKDKRKVYFTNQAYSALALSYAELPDGWKRARDYFRKQGGDELARPRLEAIARIYNKQDKTEDEIAVYEYLIGSAKTGPKVPEYAGYVTAAIKKGEDLQKTDETINRFFSVLDPKGSWWVANKTIEEPMIRAKQFREEQLDWLISKYHTKAQEVEDKIKDLERANELYARAAHFYETYLEWFPNAKAAELYEKEFFLAEIYHYQTGEWDKAMQHYRSVVKRDPKGKYSKDSAYLVILGAEEKMADAGLIERNRCDARSQKKRKGKKQKKCKAKQATVEYGEARKDDKFEPVPKTPLHATEEGFVQACAEYTDIYPKDDEVPSVSFRAAEIYIKKGHYAEGVKRLEVLMEHHSKHRWAGFAAATLFDANYRLRKWDQMERWGRYMLKRKNFKVLKKKQLKNVIAISIHEFAQELRKDKKPLKAAEQWMRFVNEFPDHDKAAIALFNSAAIMETAEKTEDAIDLYERLIKNYKKAPQSTEAHFVLGLLYESQTDFETAATYFEKMASFPDVPQMADALYNAGSIRGALEQHQKAIDIFETYVKKFPEDKNTPKLYLTIAEFYEKLGNFTAADKTYNSYIKNYKKTKGDSLVEMHLRKAKLYQKEGKKHARRDASRQLDIALRVYKKLPDAGKEDKKVRAAAAEARFLLAEYIYQDFEKITVSFPERVLKKTLVKKAELLEKAGKVYFEVLDYKSHAVTAGALFRIGESYYLFAKSLFDLPIPEELNEDEQIIYRAELDDRAAPLQEKAIEALKRALKLAHENHVYNEWSRRSATLLAKLSPELFPVVEDHAVNTEHPVPATFSTTYIADPAGKLEQMISPSKAADEAKKKKAGEKPAAGAAGAKPEASKKADPKKKDPPAPAKAKKGAK